MPETEQDQALRDLVSTVDALLDPPGCEWNRAQTHRSLVTYLIEETYELVEAIEDGDVTDLREELGDVLYQVVLHAGIASRSGEGFDLGDVVAEVDEKIRRRHPHVFGADSANGVDDIVRLWSAAKAREKTSRESAYDGVPLGLPALARAQKIGSRAEATGAVSEPAGSCAPVTAPEPDSEEAWGRWLLERVDEASSRGWDAERALRGALRERESALREAERRRRGTPQPE
ncbi:MazG family protein [Frondihabitans peucedani]|uniref:MazG family protein n=1 Tax=Frondihabitans peucedani TaxID=598626 RepID=UPI0031E04759